MATRTPVGTLITYGPTLFEAKRMRIDPSKEPRFSGDLIFNAAAQNTQAFKDLKAAISNAATTLFGEKMKDPTFKARLKLPLKPYAEGSPGDLKLHAWSNSAPGIVDGDLQPITVKGDVWAGQLARFTVNPKAFDKSGSVGVNCYLENVQITDANRPRLDGRQRAEQAFDRIPTEASSSPAGDDDSDLF